MFYIFHGDVLIGQSELEGGDPPMGVVGGVFLPADAFAPLRDEMEDLEGNWEMRRIAGLSAKTAEGMTIPCRSVEVIESGEFNAPYALEVYCNQIDYPLYAQLFPHHVKAYYGDSFKG